MSASMRHGRAAKGHGPEGGIDDIEHLIEHLREFICPSLVIVGIGSELRGDDAAGVLAARELAGKVPWAVFDAQTVPESYLMKIVERRPESLVLIDALDFGGAPGAVELAGADEITGQGPSTHGPAPLAFLEILGMMHPCRCAVLGIQPASAELGEQPTAAVQKAVELVVRAFRRLGEEGS